MLYPNLDYLIKLKLKAARLKAFTAKITKSQYKGDYSSPFRGQGVQFNSVRQYVYGDDVRNIDWRITAKMDIPYIKTFHDDRERNILICVDMCKSMFFGTRRTFKSIQASELAAIIGWYGNINNDKVGSYIFSDHYQIQHFLPPVRMKKSVLSMLKILSTPHDYHNQYINKFTNKDQITLLNSLSFMTKSHIRGSLVFIISDFLDINDELENKLSMLRKKSDIILLVINDPADVELPSIGEVICTDINKKIIINTENENISLNYKNNYMNNKNKLDEIVKRLNINVINFSTERDVYKDLLYGLKLIFNRKNTTK